MFAIGPTRTTRTPRGGPHPHRHDDARLERAYQGRTKLIDPRAEPNSLSFAKIGLIMHAIMGAWDMVLDGSLTEDEAVSLLLKVTESLFLLPW